MEYINQINSFIPPFIAFILGAIGCICFILLLTKPPKDKKKRTLLTLGYGVGFIGFIPLMISVITG